MRYVVGLMFAVGLCLVRAAVPWAASVDLEDFAVHIDGTITVQGDPLPAAVDARNFDDVVTGPGSLTITVRGAGKHFVGVFVDHEIDQMVNGFINEVGDADGTPATGQSWEIDEPGFNLMPPFPGDIFSHFMLGTLDNTSRILPGSDPTGDGFLGDDVAMALGWQVTLAAGERAVVGFRAALTAPGSGFFLVQTDLDSSAMLFFSSMLDIQSDLQSVPEPGTGVLLGSGLLGLVAVLRRWRGRGQ